MSIYIFHFRRLMELARLLPSLASPTFSAAPLRELTGVRFFETDEVLVAGSPPLEV
jgi:hypothetical protein